MHVSYVPVSVENHMPAPPMHAAKTSASRHTIARASSQGVTELHHGVNAASQRQASRCANAGECEGSIRSKNAAKRLHKRNHARCGRRVSRTVLPPLAGRMLRRSTKPAQVGGFDSEAGHCDDTGSRKKTARDAGRFGNAGGSVS
jgi:hypothetical protein